MKGVVLVLLGSLLCACASLPAQQPPQETRAGMVWVAQSYSGGRQCDASATYTPPDVGALLAAAGATVAEVRVERHGLVGLCGHRAYAATHYALIPGADLPVATGQGFKAQQPPGRP